MTSHARQNASHTFVVVGGGFAGATAAGVLREGGFTGRLVLVGAEAHPPYERPPLSKGYLMGQEAFSKALVHPEEFYDSHDIELTLGSPATALDLAAHQLSVGGQTIGYDRLLLATGSTARRLPDADRSGVPVAYLRTVEDADRIMAALQPGRRVAIIGGGWIGLEVAAAARTAECEVTVVEPLAQPLLRVLGEEVGALFAALHRSHGVDLRTSTGVSAISALPEDRAALDLDDGTSIEADLVVVGIGAVPATELATSAGLALDSGGVRADEYLRTSHPDVFVAGDIAAAFHPTLGRTVRVEHWDNAKAQGATAARNMLDAGEAYDRVPYFFSDQYDLGMEYLGHVGPEGYDELVLRGDPTGGSYTAFWVRADEIVAAMQANDWDATDHLRALLARPGTVDLAALRDPGVPLEELVR